MGSATLRRVFAVAISLVAIPFGTSAQAAFPGANGRIAFESNRDVAGFFDVEIYTMNPDGSDVRRLTFTGFNRFPTWSPDGSKILYSCTYAAACVMNADGSDNHPIAAPPGGILSPTWSPDSKRIAYQGHTAGDDEIWTMNLDGSDQRNLTNSPGDDFNPTWSPDGSRIAFDSRRDNDLEVYVMNADGSEQTRLTRSPGPDFEQEWLPSGDRLAFTSNRTGPGCCDYVIHTMKPDGSDVLPVGSGSLPAWSPDGSQLAFAPLIGTPDIHRMNADGTGVVNLTRHPAWDYNPSWQPIPVLGPQRSDYKNAAQFCKAEEAFLGSPAFRNKYGTNGSGTNAHGKCVTENR